MGISMLAHVPLPVTPEEVRTIDRETFVLDVRSPDRFAAGHLAGAGRIEAREFTARRAELPPRDARVLVVHEDPGLAREAAEALGTLGYAWVRWLDAPLDAMAEGVAHTTAAARLWRPSPFLERVLPRLPQGRALDIAAGSGRESVFLALHGFDVEAWDHAPEALERAEALAARHGVRIHTRLVDLERGDMPDPGQFQVVMAFRFLHRPLLPWLERAVAPGGALVYETFRLGQEVHGRPKHPRFLLYPGEIASVFPSLSVVLHEEPDVPGGPVMSRLLAFRPSHTL
ncbi:MAG: methyltransferase domain-containing protein [Candidatus Eisenbacteria bacterium]